MQMSDNFSAILATSLRNSGKLFEVVFSKSNCWREPLKPLCAEFRENSTNWAAPAHGPLLLPPCPAAGPCQQPQLPLQCPLPWKGHQEWPEEQMGMCQTSRGAELGADLRGSHADLECSTPKIRGNSHLWGLAFTCSPDSARQQ